MKKYKMNKKRDNNSLTDILQYNNGSISSANEPDDTYMEIAKKLRTARFAVIFATIILILISLMKYSSMVNVADLKELAYSFLNENNYDEMTDISIPATDLINVNKYKKFISVLRKDSIELYKNDGSEKFAKRFLFNFPAIKCSDKYIILYDVGGTDYKIYNSVDVVHEASLDSTLYLSDINNSGTYAVLTNDAATPTLLLVYNNNFFEIFRWNSYDKYTVSFKLSDDNKHLAVASFNSEVGTSATYFNLFDYKNGESIKTYTFYDTIPLKTDEIENGYYLLCNDRIIFFDDDGNKTEEIFLSAYGDLITDISSNDNKVVLAVTNSESSDNNTVLMLNSNGTLQFERIIPDFVSSIDCYNDFVYVLSQNVLHIFDTKGEYKTLELDDNYTDVLYYGNDTLLLSSDSKIILYKR